MVLNVSELITVRQGWIGKKDKVPQQGCKQTCTINICLGRYLLSSCLTFEAVKLISHLSGLQRSLQNLQFWSCPDHISLLLVPAYQAPKSRQSIAVPGAPSTCPVRPPPPHPVIHHPQLFSPLCTCSTLNCPEWNLSSSRTCSCPSSSCQPRALLMSVMCLCHVPQPCLEKVPSSPSLHNPAGFPAHTPTAKADNGGLDSQPGAST